MPGLVWRERLRINLITHALADVAADLPGGTVGHGYQHRLRGGAGRAARPVDVILLLDTAPGRGNLSGMAVLAADGLLIPALAADLDVRGAGKLYDLVEGEVPGLRILGVVIAASERRWRITRDATSRMDGRRDEGAAGARTAGGPGGVSASLSSSDRGARARLDGQSRLPPAGPSPASGGRAMSQPQTPQMQPMRRRPVPGMALRAPLRSPAARPLDRTLTHQRRSQPRSQGCGATPGSRQVPSEPDPAVETSWLRKKKKRE